MFELSNIFVVFLFCLAVLSSWIGIDYNNKCKAGLDDKQSASNKSFLISMTFMSVIIAVYKVLPKPMNMYFMTLVMCAVTIASSSIGIEFKNKCTDGLKNTNDTMLILILVGSILTCILAIWTQHKAAIKNASKLIKNKAQNTAQLVKNKARATKITYNATRRANQMKKNLADSSSSAQLSTPRNPVQGGAANLRNINSQRALAVYGAAKRVKPLIQR